MLWLNDSKSSLSIPSPKNIEIIKNERIPAAILDALSGKNHSFWRNLLSRHHLSKKVDIICTSTKAGSNVVIVSVESPEGRLEYQVKAKLVKTK